MSRPTKLTPDTQKRICECVELGLSYEHSCNAAGVSYTAMRNWINRAEAELERVNANSRATVRKNEEPYLEFLDSIRTAEAAGVEANLKRIIKAADEGAWRASAWILERRHPEYFAKKEKLDMKVEHPGGVQIVFKDVDCSKWNDEPVKEGPNINLQMTDCSKKD